MGTIKIEFDLPEFKEELQINIVIRKDGEVVCKTTTPSSPAGNSEEKIEGDIKVTEKPKTATKSKKSSESSSSAKKGLGGNMMSFDF